MAENGPFGTPFLAPKFPSKKFVWAPFFREFFPRILTFFLGPKMGGVEPLVHPLGFSMHLVCTEDQMLTPHANPNNFWDYLQEIASRGKRFLGPSQQVLNPTPLNPTPATCHERKRKLRCNFRNAAQQKLHCNIGFSAVRMLFLTKSCAAASKKLQCNIEKAALQESGAFLQRIPADFKLPRLGTHF